MHTNLAPEIYRKRIIIEGKYHNHIDSHEYVHNFLLRLTKQIQNDTDLLQGMRGPFVQDYEYQKEVGGTPSFEGSVIWNEHEARIYVWTQLSFFTLDLYTCAPFETDVLIDFVEKEFETKDITWHELPQPSPFTENNLIELRPSTTDGLGTGVFAKADIPSETFLTYIDGEVLFAEKESDLFKIRKTTVNHSVAFSRHFYRNAFNSLAVKINHSCEPNAYIKDLFCVYTMRDIKMGEEVTLSYSLFMNSDWQVPGGKCLCDSKNCYGTIVPWRDLTPDDKRRYLPYTADWILYEEMRSNGFVQKLEDMF